MRQQRTVLNSAALSGCAYGDGWALCSPTERRRNEVGEKPRQLGRSPEALQLCLRRPARCLPHCLSSATRDPYARKPLDPLPNSGSQNGKKYMVRYMHTEADHASLPHSGSPCCFSARPLGRRPAGQRTGMAGRLVII